MYIVCDVCDTYLYVCNYVFFFFFKQKTAYDMRISDWSSDVCSSDLGLVRRLAAGPGLPTAESRHAEGVSLFGSQNQRHGVLAVRGVQHILGGLRAAGRSRAHQQLGAGHGPDPGAVLDPGADRYFPAGLAAGLD